MNFKRFFFEMKLKKNLFNIRIEIRKKKKLENK